MLTTNQAAYLANVARVTILKWIARGDLPAEKVGRDWIINRDILLKIAPAMKAKAKGGKPTHKTAAE